MRTVVADTAAVLRKSGHEADPERADRAARR